MSMEELLEVNYRKPSKSTGPRTIEAHGLIKYIRHIYAKQHAQRLLETQNACDRMANEAFIGTINEPSG